MIRLLLLLQIWVYTVCPDLSDKALRIIIGDHFKTHICLVDPSILINWPSQFPVLGVSSVLFHFYSISNNILVSKQWRPWSMPRSEASDLSLHCLLMSQNGMLGLYGLVGWLCWGLTSQSTIFQSCRDGAIASWVINQYFRGVKCLAQGHNTAAVGFEPRTSRSGVRYSTTEPPRSPLLRVK